MSVSFEGVLQPCGHLCPVSPTATWDHLKGNQVSCNSPGCGVAVDWPGVIRSSFEGAGAVFGVLSALGGRQITAMITLEREKLLSLDLGDFGVPEAATIRGFNLTGNSVGSPADGMLRPAMLIENEFRRPSFPHFLQLYGFPAGNAPERENFALLVQYIEPFEDVGRQLLAEAGFAHGDGDFRKAVIEAHTAADLALTSFAVTHLGLAETRLKRMPFMEKFKVAHRATPELAVMGLALEPMAGELNVERNGVAHPRIPPPQLSQGKSAACLLTALFIFHMLEAAAPAPAT